MAIKITKGDKSVTMVRRPRRGKRDGTGPLAGTRACPYSASEQANRK